MNNATHKTLITKGLGDPSEYRITGDEGACRQPGLPCLALVGGFLGAGKTTFIGRVTRDLRERGLRCAVVSNDQSVGLVDTAAARMLEGAAVGEVTGACFCCKLDDLVAVVARLRAEERPDVILCEPVGSCTDLVATVVRPLESLYQTGFRLTPFTVLLDARRAAAAFGGARRKKDFAKDVGYIFRKQVEEAAWLFVNKAETMTEGEREGLRAALAKAFPEKRVWFGSAKAGDGVTEWMEESIFPRVQEEADERLPAAHCERRNDPAAEITPAMDESCATTVKDHYRDLEIDYGVYARGEAMLGWYNARLGWRSAAPADGNGWLLETGRRVSARLEERGLEVAHFKAALIKTQDGKTQEPRQEGDMAVVNQVLSGEDPSLSREMEGEILEGELLVNLRAEGDANDLKAIVREVLDAPGPASLTWLDEAAFQPGEPKPTHRLAGGGVIGY